MCEIYVTKVQNI